MVFSAMHMPDRSSEPQALIELLCEKEEAKLEELPEMNSRDGSLSSSKIGCIAPCDSGVAIVEAFLEVTEVTGSGCFLGGRLLASNTLVLCSTYYVRAVLKGLRKEHPASQKVGKMYGLGLCWCSW